MSQLTLLYWHSHFMHSFTWDTIWSGKSPHHSSPVSTLWYVRQSISRYFTRTGTMNPDNCRLVSRVDWDWDYDKSGWVNWMRRTHGTGTSIARFVVNERVSKRTVFEKWILVCTTTHPHWSCGASPLTLLYEPLLFQLISLIKYCFCFYSTSHVGSKLDWD